MLANASTNCYSPEWRARLWTSLCMIVMYTFGIPIGVLTLLLSHREAIVNRAHVESMAMGTLFLRFTPDFFYWQLVDMARKLGLSLTALFVTSPFILQAMAGAAVLLFALIAQVWARPFEELYLNNLEFATILISLLLLLLGSILTPSEVPTGAAYTAVVVVSACVLVVGILVIALAVGIDVRTTIQDLASRYRRWFVSPSKVPTSSPRDDSREEEEGPRGDDGEERRLVSGRRASSTSVDLFPPLPGQLFPGLAERPVTPVKAPALVAPVWGDQESGSMRPLPLADVLSPRTPERSRADAAVVSGGQRPTVVSITRNDPALVSSQASPPPSMVMRPLVSFGAWAAPATISHSDSTNEKAV